MPLILLRHTKPEGGDGLCYGRTDLPLDADFEASASALLADLPEISAIVSSPLTRCRRLAERIAGARHRHLRIDARISEMDFGAWEGRPWADIPRGEIDTWAADLYGARPHGGENVTMLIERVGAALAETVAPDDPVLWVTHLGVVRAVRALRGIDRAWESHSGFGEWIRFTDTNQRWSSQKRSIER